MKDILRKVYHHYYRFSQVSVLGRVACLGNEILVRLKLAKGLINHQKSRIDFLLELDKNPAIYTDASMVYPFLQRTYIIGTIEQQRSNFFYKRKPNLIFLDSFSELTDQLFVNKQTGKKFLANYSDIFHSNSFNEVYNCSGLLPLDGLEDYYEKFFNKLFEVYPQTDVFFIHFPTTLETRDKFCIRGRLILKIIDHLSKIHPYLHSISIDDSLVFKSEDESDELKDFPYHYSETTYCAFVDKIRNILVNKKILQ